MSDKERYMYLVTFGKVFTFETTMFDFEHRVHLFLNEHLPFNKARVLTRRMMLGIVTTKIKTGSSYDRK